MNVELKKTQAGQYENDFYCIQKEYERAQGTPGYLDHRPGGYDWIVLQKRWDDDGDVCLGEVARHNTFKQAKAEVQNRTRSLLHAAPVMLSVLERLCWESDNPNAVLDNHEKIVIDAGQAIDLAKGFRQSWAVIDENGEEFIGAESILFDAAGDVSRAKQLAKKIIRDCETGGEGPYTVEKRAVRFWPREYQMVLGEL